ncbi:MAG TPA: hypothetical protein VFC50_01865 [Candidatus Dormibacteraeota bacterium]|nr:hypothetical protein [Candidatus Dormibacteraeota bacterium]
MIVQPTLIENVLIVIGEGFWVLSGAAQLRRLVTSRNTRGLSAPSQTLNAAANIAWCTYFGMNHLWYPFVTNVLVLGLTIALLGYTLSNRKQFVRGLITIVIVGPLTSYGLLRFPAESGWFGMVYNWIANTPWLIRVVRRKKVSGISERSLYFSIGALLCTMTYGLLIHLGPLIAGGIVGLVYAGVITTHYYRYRQHG